MPGSSSVQQSAQDLLVQQEERQQERIENQNFQEEIELVVGNDPIFDQDQNEEEEQPIIQIEEEAFVENDTTMSQETVSEENSSKEDPLRDLVPDLDSLKPAQGALKFISNSRIDFKNSQNKEQQLPRRSNNRRQTEYIPKLVFNFQNQMLSSVLTGSSYHTPGYLEIASEPQSPSDKSHTASLSEEESESGHSQSEKSLKLDLGPKFAQAQNNESTCHNSSKFQTNFEQFSQFGGFQNFARGGGGGSTRKNMKRGSVLTINRTNIVFKIE